MEYHHTCAYDVLLYYDGPIHLGNVPRKYCSENGTYIQQSICNEVEMVFITDVFVNRRGFKINYNAATRRFDS